MSFSTRCLAKIVYLGAADRAGERKVLAYFKLPAAKDPEHKTWREAWLGEITKSLEKDAEFQKMIDNDTVFTCEKHFKPDEIEICK